MGYIFLVLRWIFLRRLERSARTTALQQSTLIRYTRCQLRLTCRGSVQCRIHRNERKQFRVHFKVSIYLQGVYSFQGVCFINSGRLPSHGFPVRLNNVPESLQELESLARSTDLHGSPLTDEELSSFDSHVRILQQCCAQESNHLAHLQNWCALLIQST